MKLSDIGRRALWYWRVWQGKGHPDFEVDDFGFVVDNRGWPWNKHHA